MPHKYTSSLFHPLDWPTGYQRTESPRGARFKQTFYKARLHLEEQIAHFGGTSIIISTNWELTGTGSLKATNRQPDDTGVSVFFSLDGKEVAFACDHWDCVEDNLRSIGLTIEALRGIDRWKVSDMLSRIFQGFMALPESASAVVVDKFAFLGVLPSASKDEVKKAIRKKRMVLHPDQNGGEYRPEWYQLQEIAKEFGL